MNIQQPNRASYSNQARPAVATVSTVRAKQPGILSRIGKAVGDILNGPQVVQKQNSANGVDRFQMQKTNYQVSIQKDLNTLTYKGMVARPALSKLDGQMLAWMNNEVIGTAPKPTTPPSARPAGRR